VLPPNKQNVLISRRYKLHPASTTNKCSKDIMDAYCKKEKNKNKTSRYSDQNLIVATQTTVKTLHSTRSPCFQNNSLNKVISRHNQLRPDLGFSP
jgi:hypothetical protein